jgi:5'/3'-nucleotidase SurE
MHLPLTLALLPLAARAVNVISANDDGWAEKNIRTFYDSLTTAGHSVVISSPAENQSGKGMLHHSPSLPS